MSHLLKYFFTFQWMREKTADDLLRAFITEGDRLAVTHQATADHSAALARMYRERSASLRAELAITAAGKPLEVASPPLPVLDMADALGAVEKARAS